MSTFRSRQRAAQRRQPTSFAERNAPPAGNDAPPAGQAGHNPRFGNDKRGFDKPRDGNFAPRGERREGGFQRDERSFDKPRFGGDKPRDGNFAPRGERREGGFQRDERSFDKPRFGGDKPRDGNFAPRGEHREGGFQREERSFDKPRFGGDKPRDGNFAPRGERREGGFQRDERSFDKPRFGGDKPRDGNFAPRGEHREGGFQREERSFDKPRFGGDKPRDGNFAPRGERREGGFQRDERSFDKPRFGGDKPRDGNFAPRGERREGGFQRDERSFDKPRFGGDKPRDGNFAPRGEHREGGFQRDERSFDKPRFGGDKPRDGNFAPRGERREGGFQRDERSFDKPRFGGDKPRDGNFAPRGERREGGFQRDERSFDKPRFGGDKPRDGNFAPRGERREGGFQREERSFDKPRFGGDKPRDGNFAPRGERREGGFQREERSFDKPRFGSEKSRDGNFAPRGESQGDNHMQRSEGHAPRGDHGLDKPRTLFGGKSFAPAADTAAPAPAERPQKTYTRDRVAGRGGKAHPDYVAPPSQDDNEAPAPAATTQPPRTGFLKRVGDAPAAPQASGREDGFQREERSFDKPRFGGERREGGFQREERSFDKPRFGGERREGGFQREERSFDKPRFGGERREGGFQREERSFDKPRFGGERREGGFQREERSFDKPRFGGERREGGFQREERSFDKPRFGGERREGGEQREARGEHPRQHGGDKVGRTPFVKAQPRSLKAGEFALFASCPRGLEKILADEVTQQGGTELQLTDGGVAFTGNREVMMRVNLHSRTASRLLMQLAMGTYRDERDIYNLARGIDWPALFDVGCTIKVKTDGHARLKSIDYVSLVVKDAICDRFRELGGERPSVDTRTPDMRIRVFLSGFDIQIYLDTSGEALFKRGWREETGEAPLRENLAAGILLLAGYNGTQPLLDPMCGSGTFLVEAADIALNRAPGRDRRFAFELLKEHNDLLWHSIKNDAELASRQLDTLPLFGNDRSAQMVDIARRNLERVGIDHLVTLSTGDATAITAPADSGLIVCNPPYGVRLDEQESLAELYPLLATWLKRQFAGWTAHLMTADSRLPGLMRLAADTRPMLFNGALECRVYGFALVEGSNRKDKHDTSGQ